MNKVLVIKTIMMEGRTGEQKEALIRRISEVATEELGWPLEEVCVVSYDVSKENWGIAGSSVAKMESEAR
jgi:4-oxalocrotonate tautomerase